MNIPMVIAFIVVLFRPCRSFMDLQEFEETIGYYCYNIADNSIPREERINGQISPLPNSIETFVSLVERIENKYEWGIEKIIENILANFRYDDVENYEDTTFNTRGGTSVTLVHEILHILLNRVPRRDLLEGTFTNDEKCALYFMVSHTVNDTFEDNTQQSLELGVVNLNGRTRHAFALGKVLLGIFAGLQKDETIKASDIYSRYKKDSSKPIRSELSNVEFSLLHSVTMADIIYLSLPKPQKGGAAKEPVDLFRPNGLWNDAMCPTKYVLDSDVDVYASYALIRGAIDGLYLGKLVRELSSEKSNIISLSQLLRSYYSPSKDINWCARRTVFKQQLASINEAAVHYSSLLNALTDTSKKIDTLKSDVESITNSIEFAAQQIFEDAKSNEDRDLCDRSDASTKVEKCETPRNMLAVLDLKTSDENKEKQYQIIGNLSVGFQMHPDEASMGVYTNLKPFGGGVYLDTIVGNSNISGCQSCAAMYFKRISTAFENEVEVISDLNRTLELLSNPDEPGIPSKVVLYFNYGNPREDYKIRSAIGELRSAHRGAKIFAIGPSRELLKPFVENIDREILFQNDMFLVINNLKDRICKVPAELQYKNCYTFTSRKADEDAYMGFITPYHTQYLAMYPNYFLKSYDIKMWFSTNSGKIKVCYSRDRDIDNIRTKGTCKDAEGSERPAIFTVSNPCKKRDVDNCLPFYFSVEAVNEPSEKCSDKKCKTQRQIAYQFQHEGISCNGAFFASYSHTTISIALLVSLCFIFKSA